MSSSNIAASSTELRRLLWQMKNTSIYITTCSSSDVPFQVLKVVPLHKSNQSEVRNQQFAVTLSPGVVAVYSGQRYKSKFHIQMELCPGGDLSQEIYRRAKLKTPWPTEDLYIHALSLTETLSVLHSQQLTHRDVKPANIFLTGCGKLKLGDFGHSNRGKTEAAERHGTCIYMSPELYYWKGGVVDYCASDSFSLGKTLFEMATLRHMDDLYSYYDEKDRYSRYVSSALREVRDTLCQVIQGLMAFDPEERWSCKAAVACLQSTLGAYPDEFEVK